MAKDPEIERQRRARELDEQRIKDQLAREEHDKALAHLKSVDKNEYKANQKAAEKAVESALPQKKKTQAQLLEEEGQKLRGFNRRGRGKDKGRDFGR